MKRFDDDPIALYNSWYGYGWCWPKIEKWLRERLLQKVPVYRTERANMYQVKDVEGVPNQRRVDSVEIDYAIEDKFRVFPGERCKVQPYENSDIKKMILGLLRPWVQLLMKLYLRSGRMSLLAMRNMGWTTLGEMTGACLRWRPAFLLQIFLRSRGGSRLASTMS